MNDISLLRYCVYTAGVWIIDSEEICSNIAVIYDEVEAGWFETRHILFTNRIYNISVIIESKHAQAKIFQGSKIDIIIYVVICVLV